MSFESNEFNNKFKKLINHLLRDLKWHFPALNNDRKMR